MEGQSEIAALGTRIDAVERRVSKHGEEIDDLKIGMAKTDVILSRIDSTVGQIDAKLDELGAKPGQRWESLTAQILAIIVAAFMAVALSRMGFR